MWYFNDPVKIAAREAAYARAMTEEIEQQQVHILETRAKLRAIEQKQYERDVRERDKWLERHRRRMVREAKAAAEAAAAAPPAVALIGAGASTDRVDGEAAEADSGSGLSSWWSWSR